MGLTINIITLFGMVMVLGMIVDFSIVVSENAHRYMEMGLNKIDAIEKGVVEVIWPVTVTLLCICAAFGPLLFLTGNYWNKLLLVKNHLLEKKKCF